MKPLHISIFPTLTALLSLGKVIATFFILFSATFSFLLFSTFYSATPESLQAMDIMGGKKLIVNIGEFSFQLATWATALVTGTRFLYGFQKQKRRCSDLKATTLFEKTNRDKSIHLCTSSTHKRH